MHPALARCLRRGVYVGADVGVRRGCRLALLRSLGFTGATGAVVVAVMVVGALDAVGALPALGVLEVLGQRRIVRRVNGSRSVSRRRCRRRARR